MQSLKILALFLIFVIILSCGNKEINNDSSTKVNFEEFINILIQKIPTIEKYEQQFRALSKDEFEKTDEYEKRRYEFVKTNVKALSDSILENLTLVFKPDEFEYKADFERIEFSKIWPNELLQRYSKSSKYKIGGGLERGIWGGLNAPNGNLRFFICFSPIHSQIYYYTIDISNIPSQTAKLIKNSFTNNTAILEVSIILKVRLPSEKGFEYNLKHDHLMFQPKALPLKINLVDKDSGEIFSKTINWDE